MPPRLQPGTASPPQAQGEVDGALLADLQFHILRFNLGERSGFDDVVNTRQEVIESIESVLRCLGGADYICFHVVAVTVPPGTDAPCGSSARLVNLAKAALWPNAPDFAATALKTSGLP